MNIRGSKPRSCLRRGRALSGRRAADLVAAMRDDIIAVEGDALAGADRVVHGPIRDHAVVEPAEGAVWGGFCAVSASRPDSPPNRLFG